MFRILVCVKAIPNTTDVSFDADGKLQRSSAELQWNVADLAALEAALTLRTPESTVTVLTMGPQKLEAALKELLARGVPAKCTALQAIGYKEFIAALEGEITVSEAADQVRQSSRRYAKRQLTWFRRNENMNWIKRRTEQSSEEIFALARQLVKDIDN